MALANLQYPSIIVSASGMLTGGRVIHHLARLLPDPKNAIILAGFQADGTRGRRLLDGERSLKMFGQYVPVRAQIASIDSFSVHADRAELLAWLGRCPTTPDVAYVVHGTEHASDSLRDAIIDDLGWNAAVPNNLEQVLVN